MMELCYHPVEFLTYFVMLRFDFMLSYGAVEAQEAWRKDRMSATYTIQPMH